MLTSLHLHKKSSGVSIKTRSTPASLSIQARTLSTQLQNGLLIGNRTTCLSNLEIIGFKKFLGLPIWQSSEFFSSNYFQIGQHVVLLHILISGITPLSVDLICPGDVTDRKTSTFKPRQCLR